MICPPRGTVSRRSLSARRAWIEMSWFLSALSDSVVALRKESVDRNVGVAQGADSGDKVALRKESVDRNFYYSTSDADWVRVALRKESVDRNTSLLCINSMTHVALRKESVDRNGLSCADTVSH